MNIRISARSYLMLLLLSICTAFAGILFYFFQNRIDDARAQALDQTLLFSAIASKAIDAFHSDLLLQAQTISRRPEIEAALSGQSCLPWLATEASERAYTNVFIFNSREEFVCSARDIAKWPAPPRNPDRAAPSRERGTIGSFFPYAKDSWAFPVTFPITAMDGRSIGTIVLTIEASRLDLFRDALTDRGAEISYIDPSGRIGLARVSHSNMRFGEMAPPNILSVINNAPGAANHLKARSLVLADGAFAASSKALLSGWTIFVSLGSENVYAPLHDGIWHQTLVLAVFCIFALLSIWGIANRLSSATTVLVRAAGNAESLFSAQSTGVREIDFGIDEMKKASRERSKANATIELWREASERSRSGMAILRLIVKPGGGQSLSIELRNPAFEELAGIPKCIGKDILREAAPQSVFGDKATAQELRSCVANIEPAARTTKGLDIHGRLRHVQMSVEPLTIGLSKDLFCVTLEDITEISAREAELEKQSSTDGLTNLPNRALFESLMSKSISISQRNKSLCAIAFFDVDHFKNINDSVGHDIGDKVIIEIASRMAGRLRPGDTVSRFAGDEFGVIFTDVPNLETIASLVENSRDVLRSSIALDNQSFDLTFSVGVAVYPDDGDKPAALMSCADLAMFQAKENGRGNVQFHSKTMSEAFSERLILEQALKSAIADHSIEFLYQPKISIATGQPCGMEALARWSHPVLGSVSPSKFIPLAEESELIATLGDLAISTALRDAKILWDQGFRNMPVAINVSPKQIKDGFTKKLLFALETSGLPPQAVHVEITESSIMPNSDVTKNFLSELSRLGIKVALDDFGTGWSNMAMLKNLPLSYLKMDRSFIIGLGKDEKDAAIAKAIIGLAKALNVEVIAEGVETQMQAQQLLYLEADQIQGYYVCKPLSIDEVSKWLHNGCVFQGAPALPASAMSAHLPLAPLSIMGLQSEL